MKIVVTAISHQQGGLTEAKASELAKLIGDVNGTKWLCEGKACDLYVVADDIAVLKQKVAAQVEPQFPGIDLIVQADNEFRKQKGLFVFDMDSTLIYQEVIEMIAAYANVEAEVKKITDRAMNNELDFSQSLCERVKLLKGIETEHLYEEIKPRLQVTKGVPELSRALKRAGCKLAVLSGGFIPFAKYIQEKLDFDYALANTLGVEQGPTGKTQLNGTTLGDIVDGQRKADTLVSLAQEYGVPIEATVMVGDGGNDLKAMEAAGFGIAWNAKPKVQEQAPCKLNSDTMVDVLYILGYTHQEIEQLVKL
ncbi:phosphoserine phosphatase [Kluyveromyces marxianus DMKU3-1042]|uniref:phosphoserine phosphatase n=1 Tax=Kluyveromyces marxianus (strain DMKU3-1042 / BCC 29191 / NBRC 104275) TaxID=1003335 RepID=W0TGZ0_KLUMD|nr:phosphoserine phosphatase [Kluyveromyces marxianus DMKU3-1042]BAO41369.1 phosphoserine phosphatase [Kluyveromyces marxianus DMKU3-1042]